MTHDIRKFMNLMEQAQQLDELDLVPTASPEDKEDLPLDQVGRDDAGRATHQHITMTQDGDKVVAQLTHYESGRYTNLAKKVLRIKELSAEIKVLEEDVKAGARTDIADLFGAKDIAFTRVIQTRSFILQLTKDPKPTNSVAYAKVLADLEKSLTPELVAVLETLKKKYTTVTQKAPALSVDKIATESIIEEGMWDKIKDVLARLKATIESWATSFDAKLGALKLEAGMAVDAPIAEEIDNSKEVQELNGFSIGDRIYYTAVEESPPGNYEGKIVKIYDNNEALVDWNGAHPKKVANRVSLHNCRNNPMLNKQQAQNNDVAESVDYSRIDRIEKQVEFMAKNGRSRAYIIANIGEKMGAEEAEYAGDYYDQNFAHMATATTESATIQKKEVTEGSLFGFKYLKEGDEEEGSEEGDEELTSEDLGENLDPLVREFNEFMGSGGKTMAFPVGSTVYCGSRQGVVKGTADSKPDTLVVELPNGQLDAFPMSQTSNKAPGMVRKAVQWMVGEDAEMVNEGDESSAQDDANALYMVLGLVVPGADIWTPSIVDPGKLAVGVDPVRGKEIMTGDEFNRDFEPKLKAAFMQVGVTLTSTDYNFDDDTGYLTLTYTGTVNRSALMSAYGSDIQEHFEGPMENLDFDITAYAAAGAPEAESAHQAIDGAMSAMMQKEYHGFDVKRGYLYISFAQYGRFSERDGDRIARVLNNALGKFGVSVAYDHKTGDGLSFEIMNGEL